MPKISLGLARFPGDNREDRESTNLFLDLYMRAKVDPRISRVRRWDEADTPITMVRNRCLKDMADAGIDYVIMLDSDVGMHPEQESFYEHAIDFAFANLAGPPIILGAPYVGGTGSHPPYIFHWSSARNQDAANGPNQDLQMYSREYAANATGIEECAALPTGLILVDMRLVTGWTDPETGNRIALAPPWFYYEFKDKFCTEKASTEDVVFTRNASMLGAKCFVDWDCWVIHWKRQPLCKPYTLSVDAVRGLFRDARVNRYSEGDEAGLPAGCGAGPEPDDGATVKMRVGTWKDDEHRLHPDRVQPNLPSPSEPPKAKRRPAKKAPRKKKS